MIWALFTLLLWFCGLAVYSMLGLATLGAIELRAQNYGYNSDPVIHYFMAIAWPVTLLALVLNYLVARK